MGFVSRRDFSLGWMPNADATNAPENAVLRADNLTLDERGVLALRPGSTPISTLADHDVHSLFTTVLNGTRYRMAGAGNAVYANGNAIATGLAGSSDIAFGFQNGQILFARGTSTSKYDGTTVRNWGIRMTGAVPSVAAIPPDGHEILRGANDFKVIEGLQPDIGPNHYLASDPRYRPFNGAMVFRLDPDTKRAVYEFDFDTPKDFTVYDAGQLAADDDVMTLWVYMSDPKQLTTFAVQIDVNDGTFLEDWYESPLVDGSLPIQPSTSAGQSLSSTPSTLVFTPKGPVVQLPAGGPGSGGTADPAAGWMKVQWHRSQFVRMGTTFGKGWATVKAVRFLVQGTSPSLVVSSEGIPTGPRLGGGGILGSARWCYAYVRNASGYLALSALSAASAEDVFDAQNASVTIPGDGGRDSQVNEVWLYREDQLTNGLFYRVAVQAVSGTAGVTITDATKSQDALTINVPAVLDLVTPPDNIIGIAGPHFDRTLVLTSDGQVWPSRKLDPDAFSTGQAITVAGKDETAYWIVRALNDIFIGTSKDIYRLEGTGAELEDGSVDYVLRPMSMDHRPVNAGVAHEGNQLVFFSDDGWRGTEGNGSTLLTGVTSLLYRGQTRHGVSPVNVAAGRVRAALGKGQLVAITPEGASTTSSSILYRYVFTDARWYRHVYAQSGHWRSMTREPDGTLLAGDDAGVVWVLDTGTQDNGQSIPVTLWTKVDDLGLSDQRKKIGELTVRSDTGGASASIAVHRNGSGTAAATVTAAQTGMGLDAFDLGNVASSSVIAILTQVQLRLTGSFATFRLYDVGFQFRERPVPLIGRVVDTLSGSPGVKLISGFVLKGNTLGAARTITAYLDGVADAETFALTTSAEEPETHTLSFTGHARRATDVGLAIDGVIELDSWSAIVTQREPVGVRVWDSGPFMDGEKELVWLRELLFKVRAGADLVVTPYFDGVAFPSVTIAVTPASDTVYRIPVGRSYVGRQPRIVVTSCDPFHPYWVKAVRRTTGSPSQKPHVIAPMTLETDS